MLEFNEPIANYVTDYETDISIYLKEYFEGVLPFYNIKLLNNDIIKKFLLLPPEEIDKLLNHIEDYDQHKIERDYWDNLLYNKDDEAFINNHIGGNVAPNFITPVNHYGPPNLTVLKPELFPPVDIFDFSNFSLAPATYSGVEILEEIESDRIILITVRMGLKSQLIGGRFSTVNVSYVYNKETKKHGTISLTGMSYISPTENSILQTFYIFSQKDTSDEYKRQFDRLINSRIQATDYINLLFKISAICKYFPDEFDYLLKDYPNFINNKQIFINIFDEYDFQVQYSAEFIGQRNNLILDIETQKLQAYNDTRNDIQQAEIDSKNIVFNFTDLAFNMSNLMASTKIIEMLNQSSLGNIVDNTTVSDKGEVATHEQVEIPYVGSAQVQASFTPEENFSRVVGATSEIINFEPNDIRSVLGTVASISAFFGPAGMVLGGAIGAIGSLFGGGDLAKKKAEAEAKYKNFMVKSQQAILQSVGRIEETLNTEFKALNEKIETMSVVAKQKYYEMSQRTQAYIMSEYAELLTTEVQSIYNESYFEIQEMFLDAEQTGLEIMNGIINNFKNQLESFEIGELSEFNMPKLGDLPLSQDASPEMMADIVERDAESKKLPVSKDIELQIKKYWYVLPIAILIGIIIKQKENKK